MSPDTSKPRGVDQIPRGDLRGQFRITDAAVAALERLLPTYRGVDGSHEGIAFLAGFEMPGLTLFTTVFAPDADHGWGHVRCSEAQVSAVTQAAHAEGLGVLAQVHTHPSGGTGHSWGDDEMVLMPYEGMLSIVVPQYAAFGVHPLYSLGVHQFQEGRWVLCSTESVRAAFHSIPSGVDLR